MAVAVAVVAAKEKNKRGLAIPVVPVFLLTKKRPRWWPPRGAKTTVEVVTVEVVTVEVVTVEVVTVVPLGCNTPTLPAPTLCPTPLNETDKRPPASPTRFTVTISWI